MILGLQITAAIFALIMIYLAIIHYKKGELNGMEIFSWVVIWSVTIFAVVFPEILRTYARSFSVSRLFDLMVLGGFVLVISMVASAYVRTRRMEKKLEELVRKEALKDATKTKIDRKK